MKSVLFDLFLIEQTSVDTQFWTKMCREGRGTVDAR